MRRQGPDVGSQYRSAIFCDRQEQKWTVLASIDQANTAKAFSPSIVTQLVPFHAFYPAEDYR